MELGLTDIERKAAKAFEHLSFLLKKGWRVEYVINPVPQFVMWNPLNRGITIRDECIGGVVEKAMEAFRGENAHL